MPYIITGLRTAVGKANRGGFRFTRADDLAVHTIRKLLQSIPGLEPEQVDDVIVGNAVPEAEQGLQMGRWVALRAINKDIPGMTVNRYCATGLEVISIAHAKIQAGMADCIVAGGAESMSQVPITGWKTALHPDIAENTPEYYLSMGLTAERIAKKYKVSREDQDAFAYKSHKKALNAIEKGYFKDQIVPYEVKEKYVEGGKAKVRDYTVDTDEGPRKDTSKKALAKLQPVFAKGGSVTAGNASQTSDGAAFVVVMSEKMMKKLKLEPEARLVSCASAGVDPELMGIGPVAAVPLALKQASMKLQDMDLIELNEAFASQALAVSRELDFDMDLLNVNGGAIALGHPLACTGTKLTIQTIHELRRRKKKYGMITACVGGGQGIAGVIERLK